MSLVLGPVLRHVGETTASVWVQLDRAATVTVLGCQARTFEVCGHHYAVVAVTGLEPDTRYPYEVLVDGKSVWPPPVSPYPPSVVRTRGPESARQHRIIFGSCRYAKVVVPKLARQLGIDALDAYAARMARRPHKSGQTRCCCSATRSTPTSSPPRTAAASPAVGAATPTGPTTRSSATTNTSVSTATHGPTPRSAGSCPASPPR